MNTTPAMAKTIRAMREEGYANMMGNTVPAVPQPSVPMVPQQPASLSDSQKQALIRRQQALKTRQLQAAAKANSVNREAAAFAAEGFVRESIDPAEDIPDSMRVNGTPLPQPENVTTREHMKSAQSFFSSSYERSTADKLRLFKSLRNAIVCLQGDSKFAALREIDSIERNIQKEENFDSTTKLFADDILSWFAEISKAPGDLEFLVMKLAESSDNGYISTPRCKCLIDARSLIEQRQVAQKPEPELDIGCVEEDESVASDDSDSDIPPPPKKKVTRAAKTTPRIVQRNVVKRKSAPKKKRG
jgi:hypothetical protein